MLTPVRELFGIDTRSLAVFRIALGLAILADLLIKAPDLAAFYTDDGVLPRALLAEQVGARAPALLPILNLVPHVAFDGVPGQALLFVLAGAVAVLLIVGWQTRWVTIASWVLLTSLQARNPAVRNAGDDLFRLLLFWSLFLPLGATWSVDARGSPSAAAPRLVTGGAPAALLLQIAIVYPVNALYKTGAAWTTDFSALELFLANDVWGNVLGQRLLEHPGLLKAMTVLTIGLERFGVLLAFSPLWHGPARTVAVALFATFHGGILVLTEIDLFAFIGLTAWTVFLPGWFWTSVVGRRHAQPADRAPLRQPVPKLQGAVALALLGYVGFLNAAGLGERFGLGDRVPTVLRAPALALQIDQEWSMFSPEPAPWTRYLAARGVTAAGSSVDLLADVQPSRPPEATAPPSGRYARERWRQYLRYVRRLPAEARRRVGRRLALHLAHQWNAAHDPEDRLERVRLYRVDAPIQLAANGGSDRRETRIRELLTLAVDSAP